MATRSLIVTRAELPEAVFDLLRIGFPDDEVDQRAFWPPDSVHAVVYQDDRLVAHAGLVVRTLYLPDRSIEVAHVKYVAAEPRGQGFGTQAMRAIEAEIRRRGFSLAALATGSPAFYERLGWRLWRGPAAYRKPDGSVVPTPNEKPMVLDLGADVNLDDPLQFDWREIGDIW